jgi:hypothetical protein
MKKILILASNPRKDLNLDREIRDLRDVVESSRNREEFDVEDALAVRVGDLQDLLLDHNPYIVHFCGHGGGRSGLVLESKDGGEQWVRTDALRGLFRLFSTKVKCVVLNACYSEEQADEIVNHIDYVIGMDQEIRDDAAIAFSKGFYRALGYGCTIEEAYEFGCNAIQLEISSSANVRSAIAEPSRRAEVIRAVVNTAIPEHLKPVLRKRQGLIESNSQREKPSTLPPNKKEELQWKLAKEVLEPTPTIEQSGYHYVPSQFVTPQPTPVNPRSAAQPGARPPFISQSRSGSSVSSQDVPRGLLDTSTQTERRGISPRAIAMMSATVGLFFAFGIYQYLKSQSSQFNESTPTLSTAVTTVPDNPDSRFSDSSSKPPEVPVVPPSGGGSKEDSSSGSKDDSSSGSKDSSSDGSKDSSGDGSKDSSGDGSKDSSGDGSKDSSSDGSKDETGKTSPNDSNPADGITSPDPKQAASVAELEGFKALLAHDLVSAKNYFGEAYKHYPEYHSVDEIYHQVLTASTLDNYARADEVSKEKILDEVFQQIVDNYSWGVPEDVLTEMKNALESTLPPAPSSY